MNPTLLEPLLRDATINAIDRVATKVAGAESLAAQKVTRLLAHWNDLGRDDKEHVVGIAIATVTAAVTALVALRRRTRSPVKRASKKVIKSAAKRAR